MIGAMATAAATAISLGYPPGAWRFGAPAHSLLSASNVFAFDDVNTLVSGIPPSVPPPTLHGVELEWFRQWVSDAEWTRRTDPYKAPPFGMQVTLSDGTVAYLAVDDGARSFRITGTPGVWGIRDLESMPISLPMSRMDLQGRQTEPGRTPEARTSAPPSLR